MNISFCGLQIRELLVLDYRYTFRFHMLLKHISNYHAAYNIWLEDSTDIINYFSLRSRPIPLYDSHTFLDHNIKNTLLLFIEIMRFNITNFLYSKYLGSPLFISFSSSIINLTLNLLFQEKRKIIIRNSEEITNNILINQNESKELNLM